VIETLSGARRLLALAAALLAASCSSSDKGDGTPAGGGNAETGGSGTALGGQASSGGANTSGGASATGGARTDAVTWSEHIAPLVYRECIGCHRDAYTRTTSPSSYEDAKPLAVALAGATADREMPPMPVNGDGSCNTFDNARWLSEAEIALFETWAAEDAPAGDPALAPELPPPLDGLSNVAATLDPGEEYAPNAALSDDYRCFIVESGLTSDAFLTGYEVIPGDARVVHHVIVYAPSSDAAASQAEALDRADAGLGYTCFGGARVDANPRVLWAPGVGVTQLPAGTGLPLVAGRKLILQVHYNLTPGSFPDRTRVRLQTSATVTRPAAYLPVADTKMSVAAGQELGTTTRTVNGIDSPVRVYGVLPHMHTLGRTLRVNANASGGSTCLVDVDRWDFTWQNAWWYAKPLEFDSITSLNITCGYDTRTRTAPVTWGEGTSDEMCLNYVYLTAR